MSTRICSAALSLALAALAAAGAPEAAERKGADRVSLTVAGRKLTLMAPKGFCIDPKATNVSASGAFVMASDCALLGFAPLPEGSDDTVGAVLTASVAARQRPHSSPAELERFAATKAGRAALSRSGQPERVKILATRTRKEVLYVLVEDRGAQPIAGIEPRFWRAFLQVQDRMTVITALGFQGAGMDPTEGLALIQRFADTLQAANPS